MGTFSGALETQFILYIRVLIDTSYNVLLSLLFFFFGLIVAALNHSIR